MNEIVKAKSIDLTSRKFLMASTVIGFLVKAEHYLLATFIGVAYIASETVLDAIKIKSRG